jgi:TPR repeat protein
MDKVIERMHQADPLDSIKCYELGLRCQKGDGILRDLVQAAKWFLSAAEQGNIDAMLCVGKAYKNGHGVPVDLILAVKWLYMAAANDCAKADRQLRYLRKELEASAKEKNPEAMYHLGAMLYNGYGVKQDLGLAFAWFRLAFEHFPDGEGRSKTLSILCAISEDMWHSENKRAARAKARIESEMEEITKTMRPQN